MITPAFHFEILSDFLNVINEKSKILVEILSQLIKSHQEIEIFQIICLCALDVICGKPIFSSQKLFFYKKFKNNNMFSQQFPNINFISRNRYGTKPQYPIWEGFRIRKNDWEVI